jgi:hypothetical protein
MARLASDIYISEGDVIELRHYGNGRHYLSIDNRVTLADGNHGEGEDQLKRLWEVLNTKYGTPQTIEQQERAKNRAAHLKGLIDEVNADPTIASVS